MIVTQATAMLPPSAVAAHPMEEGKIAEVRNFIEAVALEQNELGPPVDNAHTLRFGRCGTAAAQRR